MTEAGREFQVVGAAQLTIVCQWKSIWRANGAVEHPMISVTEFHCVLWCVDWGTLVLTSVIFWTSARLACKRCAAPPATSVISSAVDTRVIILVLHEQSLRRCSVLAAACGWYRMERRGAQRCSSRSWIESDCMLASVWDPVSRCRMRRIACA